MPEMNNILEWTFLIECKIPQDVLDLLIPGETAVAAYKTIRDSAIFTTKRLIVRNAQGLTGIKTEIFSLPFSSVHLWSTENAGIIDGNGEVELWTRAGHIKINLRRGIDIRKFDMLIASCVLKKGGQSGESMMEE